MDNIALTAFDRTRASPSARRSFLPKMRNVLRLGLFLLLSPVAMLTGQSTDPLNTSISETAGYHIGVGDVLHVSVWGQDQFTRDVTVQPDGRISMPLISEVPVSGLSVPQTEAMLHKALLHFVKAPRVTVNVVAAKSKVIYVTGEVLRPGGYLLTSETTALQLLVRSGGPTDFAKLKRAYILRSGGERLPVNLKDILKGKASAHDILLAAGDTVVVP